MADGLSATENSIRWQMKPKTMGAKINKKMTQMTVEDSTYQMADEGHDYLEARRRWRM
jgi:hypothetical protein